MSGEKKGIRRKNNIRPFFRETQGTVIHLQTHSLWFAGQFMFLLPLRFVFLQDSILCGGAPMIPYLAEVGWWYLSCHCIHAKKDLRLFYEA